MARKSTIKLLLVNKSENESERLISLFRNAGRVVRTQRPNSAEELHKLIESEVWDLFIADDKHSELAVEQCIEQLKKHQPDVPAIIIRDDNVEAAFEAGADDVINSNNDQHLISAAFRELQHLSRQRELLETKEKLQDAEQRCDQLLSQSQDAIAYVSDGMIISCNELFATRFGFEKPEDIDCTPVIDIIDAADQDSFKGLLKSQLASGKGNTDFSFTGANNNGENFSATMQLSNAVFDEEDCLQLAVRDKDSKGGSTYDRDPDTGLYNHDYFLSQLDSHIKQAAAGTSSSALLFIGIDKFGYLRGRHGITNSHELILDLATFIQHNASKAQYLTHFCDDSFTLLLTDTDGESAMNYAETLVKKIGEHEADIEGHSTQCTASIGVVAIVNQITGDPESVVDDAFAACQNVRETALNKGVGNGAFLHAPIKETRSLSGDQTDETLDAFIEEGIEDGRFELTFQPVVSLRGSTGDHYEVRTTMKDENGKELSIKESMDRINFSEPNTRLDRWIIMETTKLLAEQIENGQSAQLLINLTSNALLDESLVGWLGVVLKAGNIPPQCIILQFLESQISSHLKPARLFSDAIKELGCSTSITGFGLLSDPVKTLKHVKADYAKIASKYTDDLENGGDTQVLKAMVSSINEENSKAIISGVGNTAAMAMLWQIGVDYIQGSYLAAPAKQMDYEFTDIA